MIKTTSTSRIGDIVEYKAVVWLLQQGYEVYKNVSSVGPVDIVFMDPLTGEIKRIDVKKVVDGTRRFTKVSHPKLTPIQQKLKTVLLYYDEKNDFFAWDTALIYSNMGKEKREEPNRIEGVVFDRVFTSLSQAARHYNVNPNTVREYMRRTPSATLEQAIVHAGNNMKRIMVNGKYYTNKKSACEKFGVNLQQVEYWHYEKGMTFEEAINEVLRRNDG